MKTNNNIAYFIWGLAIFIILIAKSSVSFWFPYQDVQLDLLAMHTIAVIIIHGLIAIVLSIIGLSIYKKK
ncbi:hypothetical protein OKW22_000956 [Bacilli bacterium PM5-3]|nr:hypothetical protein [Bacilli bacterium PM5-3]MDH6603560.1 hypothetical protein [Bacilli bacterium PM5-9]